MNSEIKVGSFSSEESVQNFSDSSDHSKTHLKHLKSDTKQTTTKKTQDYLNSSRLGNKLSNRGEINHRQELMSARCGRTSIEIGPVQFQKILNDLIDNVQVDEWRNIPIVVKDSIGEMIKVFDTLKKFIITLEHRINQTNTSFDLKNDEIYKVI
jgi:hypothetical protein